MRPPSARVRLARLALDAALAVDGVVRSDPGPLRVRITAEGQDRVPGVVSAALADGRYEVSLYLVTLMVPLHPLADRIRSRVARAASQAGLDDLLGPIDIAFEDLVEPGLAVAS